MGTVLVLSSLILVCGFIAYTGDLLGRRMGKRRLTVFGLRPRHTAILCTVVTGMFIAATTLAVLIGLSAGVRLAVTRGEALVAQNRQYSRERGELEGQIGRMRHTTADLAEGNARLEEENRGLGEANQSLLRQNRSLTNEVGRLQGSSRLLTAKVNDLRSSQRELRADHRKLAGERQAAMAKLASTRVKMQSAQRELESKQKLIAGHRKVLADLNVRVTNLRARAEEFSSRTDRLILGEVIVRDQEELARATVAAESPREEIRVQVQALLARARQVAREKGARPDADHPEAAYLVFGRLARSFGSRVEWASSAERGLVELIVERLARSPVEIVLRAQALGNTARGEPVPLDIQLYRNVLAFHKGDEIASTVIDPSLTPGRMLEQLSAFLQGKVRRVSLERQVIPGPQNEIGAVRYDPLLEVAEKVKRLGVPAKVGAVAARDTRSADPLVVDFYVIPAERAVAASNTQVADDRR